MEKTMISKKHYSPNISYSLVSILLWLSYSYVSGYAAAFLIKEGFSTGRIGLVISTASVFAILFQTLEGFICDRVQKFGSRHFLCLLLLISALLSLSLCLLISHQTISGLLFGLLLSIQLTSGTVIHALANEYMNRYPRFHFGFARALGSLSSAAGMSIMGFIMESYSIIFLPLTLFFLNLFSFAASCFLLPDGSFTRNPGELCADMNSESERSPVSYGYPAFIRSHLRLMILFLGMLLIYSSASVIYNFQIWIVESLGGGSTELGISYAVGCITEVPFMFAFSFFASRFSSRCMVRSGAVFYFAKLGLFCFADRISLVYIAQLLQGPSYALLSMFSVCYVNENTLTYEKARGQALLGMIANGLAGIISSIIAGKMFDIFGTRNTVLFWFFLSFAGLLLVFIASRSASSES